ncbi:cytochrome P450 [Nocardia nova]|uniref:cytochrome P450 n=1 Tax=Nocardia nova TaxID=37330 RepID=UPI00046D4200|nr:cytochrome P450 [Nocardia nova]
MGIVPSVHIAMFMDYHPTTLGGVQTAVAALRRGLERAGHRVTVFAAPLPGASAEADPDEADGDVVELAPLAGAVVNGFPMVLPTARNAALIDAAFAARGPIDVVHTHTTYGVAIAGMKAARRHRIPLVHTAQSRDDAFIEHTSPAPYLSALALRTLHGRFVDHPDVPHRPESRAARHAWHTIVGQAEAADAVIAPTRHFADLLTAHGLTRPVRVVSNGVDDALIDRALVEKAHPGGAPVGSTPPDNTLAIDTHPGKAPINGTPPGNATPGTTQPGSATPGAAQPGNTPPSTTQPDDAQPGRAVDTATTTSLRLIWCGRLSAEKRLLESIEAVRHVTACTLDIYGEGDLSERAAALIAEYGLGDRVTLHGRVSQQRCLEAMAAADALLFPSMGFDTQGMVLLEAVAMGLPVVHCDPDLAESVPAGAGICATDASPAALAEAIGTLAADRARLTALRTEMARHRDSVRQSRTVEEITDVYRQARADTDPAPHPAVPQHLSEVPTAPGALPLIGHSLAALRDAPGFVTSLADLGPVVRIRFGRKTGYVLTTPELVREVGLGEAELNRDDLREAIADVAGGSVNVLRGTEHKLRRRMIAPALRQTRLAEYTVTAAELADSWSAGLPAGTRVDLMDEAHGLILDTVSSTLFTAEFSDPVRRRIRDNVPWLLSQVILRTALPPQIRRMRLIANARWRHKARELRSEIGAAVTEYRRRDEDFNDVVSALIRHTDPETGARLSDEHIIDEAILMLAGGVGSMASLTGWLWHEVMRRPAIAERLWAELDDVVGSGPVRADHIGKLNYLKQVVSETLRFWGPWISAGNASGPVTVGGLTIPDGTAIMFSPYLVQHDKRHFPNPEAFDPDRWSPERAEEIDKKANLSFGVGRRRCLGDHFALLEITLASAALLARWRPEPDPDYVVRASNRDFVLSPSAIPVTLHRR